MPEPGFDEAAVDAELVAQLAAGGTLSFDPDLDDDLLPGAPKAAESAAEPAEALVAPAAEALAAPAAEPAPE
jgi:hypothetical protein